jgi:hypothetical protein
MLHSFHKKCKLDPCSARRQQLREPKTLRRCCSNSAISWNPDFPNQTVPTFSSLDLLPAKAKRELEPTKRNPKIKSPNLISFDKNETDSNKRKIYSNQLQAFKTAMAIQLHSSKSHLPPLAFKTSKNFNLSSRQIRRRNMTWTIQKAINLQIQLHQLPHMSSTQFINNSSGESSIVKTLRHMNGTRNWRGKIHD